jgi:hypothetical protein
MTNLAVNTDNIDKFTQAVNISGGTVELIPIDLNCFSDFTLTGHEPGTLSLKGRSRGSKTTNRSRFQTIIVPN